jgi:hypothetical protein
MYDPIYPGLFLLVKAEATSRIGTPLAEVAIGAAVLLIIALFQTAEKSM